MINKAVGRIIKWMRRKASRDRRPKMRGPITGDEAERELDALRRMAVRTVAALVVGDMIDPLPVVFVEIDPETRMGRMLQGVFEEGDSQRIRGSFSIDSRTFPATAYFCLRVVSGADEAALSIPLHLPQHVNFFLALDIARGFRVAPISQDSEYQQLASPEIIADAPQDVRERMEADQEAGIAPMLLHPERDLPLPDSFFFRIGQAPVRELVKEWIWRDRILSLAETMEGGVPHNEEDLLEPWLEIEDILDGLED